MMRAQHAVEVTGPDGWLAHRTEEAMRLLAELLPCPGDRVVNRDGRLVVTGPTYTENREVTR